MTGANSFQKSRGDPLTPKDGGGKVPGKSGTEGALSQSKSHETQVSNEALDSSSHMPLRAQAWPLWDRLLREFAAENAIDAQAKQVRANQHILIDFLKSRDLLPDELSNLGIQAYVAQMNKTKRPQTVRNYVGTLSKFCRFLKKRGILSHNPCRDLILPRTEERLPIYLDDHETDMALRLAKQHGIYPEVCIALNTGLRRSELRNLMWQDVDLSRKALTVVQSKSKRPRTVWLNTKALQALEEQRQITGNCRYVFACRFRGRYRPNTRRGINWWVTALKPLQEAIPTFQQLPRNSTGRGWHLFRHTFASRAAQAGVSIQKISRWLGHRRISTTEIYAHLSPDYDPDIERI